MISDIPNSCPIGKFTAPGTATPNAASKTPDLSLSFGKGPPRGTSAPASPAKSRESLLQRVQSLTGAARDQGASIIGNVNQLMKTTIFLLTQIGLLNRSCCF